MKNYDHIHVAPKGIERKRAHIAGGGIAGFANPAQQLLAICDNYVSVVYG